MADKVTVLFSQSLPQGATKEQIEAHINYMQQRLMLIIKQQSEQIIDLKNRVVALEG